MSAEPQHKSWKEGLPSVRGEFIFDAPLAPLTTMRVGGNAEVLFKPADAEDLIYFMREKSADIPIHVMGEGSNSLILDGGIAGVVILLGQGLDHVEVSGNLIRAEAGANSGKVARAARTAELTGAEFLCGIPGSVGGALKMNAGAYKSETVDILEDVTVITNQGEVKILSPNELNFEYRKSQLPQGWVYLAATFKLNPGNKDEIRDRMREINKNRSTSQPLNMHSSGSWFKNVTMPDGHLKNAWKIVNEAGCRGMKVGGAQVSEKHTNFFVNTGQATAQDFIDLSEKVQKIIQENFGLKMVQEVKMIGQKEKTWT